MGAKSGLVGILMIIVGAFPLLLNIASIKNSLASYSFLSYIQAGQPLYQIILILLGVILLWNPRPRAYGYPPRR
jgi:hypothetical protein